LIVLIGAPAASLAILTGTPAARFRHAIQPTTQVESGSPATAIVSGVVVDGVTSRPIAGAIVYLGHGTRGPAGTPGRQLTDRRGRFVFVDVPASSDLRLSASRPGYLDSGFSPLQIPGASPGTLSVGAGEWRRDLRLALWRAAALEGTVRDEGGDPIAAVEVRAVAIVRVAGREHLAASLFTTTDDRGRYRIGGLPPGRYLVVVPSVQSSIPAARTDADLLGLTEARLAAFPSARERPVPIPTIEYDADMRVAIGRYPLPPPPANGQRFAYPPTYAPGTVTPLTDAAHELGPGESRTVDVQLAPVVTGDVVGRVEGAGPRANLLVRLLLSGVLELGFGFEAAVTRTDVEGRFLLVNVPVGSYVLEVPIRVSEFRYGIGPVTVGAPSPPGLGSFNSPSDQIGSGPPGLGFSSERAGGAPLARGAAATVQTDDSPLQWGRVPVTVAASDTIDLVVPLAAASTISGRVRLEGDATGLSPAAQTLSILADPARGAVGLGRPSGFADRNHPAHPFLITGVLPGEYFVRPQSSATWTIRSVTRSGRDYTQTPFVVGAAERIDDVVVTVTRSHAAIAGVLTSLEGIPMVGTTVCAFPVNRALWTNVGLSSPWLISAVSSTDGRYRLAPLPAGEYHVAVVPPTMAGQWRAPEFFAVAAATATRVDVGWGESRNLPLRVDMR
jgi:hypothetical protein